MQRKIIILDFGSQATQLIGRRVRELDTFCEILPYNKFPKGDEPVIDVIPSGSPYSVHDHEVFKCDLSDFIGKYPVLGICYGAQFISFTNGGKIESTGTREYGRARLEKFDATNPLLKGFQPQPQVWMSHGDTTTAIPSDCHVITSTGEMKYAAHASEKNPTRAVQFHPEVFHTTQGTTLLKNFVADICGSKQTWSPASFTESTVESIRQQVGSDKMILGPSGGVDSPVCATLLNKAIGRNLTCIFVDHGLLRKNEFSNVMKAYEGLGLNVMGTDASKKFFADLEGVTDSEQKHEIIGRDFVEVLNAEAKEITDAEWLAQGAIYPDRIENLSITGIVIKSHHNVDSLPKEMHLQFREPLQWLFKDEVRRVEYQLGMSEHLIRRYPFPGPGLAVRILGDITPEKVITLQETDDIYIRTLHDWICDDSEPLHDKVRQAGTVLLSTIRSVGVMGDERTHEHPVALRAVTSTDAMTVGWAHLLYEFLAKVSNEIISKVKGVNRVCYDISSEPPSTTEWE